MTDTVSLGDSAGTWLRFEIEGYPSSEGWMETTIRCQSPSFSGSMQGTIHLEDFEFLAKCLKGCADSFPGSFSFTDPEENIDMTVRLDDSGKGCITAMLATSEADLLVRIDTDQSVV